MRIVNGLVRVNRDVFDYVQFGGGEDRVLGPEGSYALYEAIPGSSLHVYPDLGHALDEDAPDFPERLMRFLRR